MRVAAEGCRLAGTHAGPRVGPGDGDRHEEGRDQEEGGGGGAVVHHCEYCRFNRASRYILCRRIELELYALLLGWFGVAKSMLHAFL